MNEETRFESFLEAIEEGDAASAARLLRARHSLSPDEIKQLADLLDPNLDAGALDLLQLKIQYRKTGKPYDPLRNRQKNTIIARQVKALSDANGSVEAAVHEVASIRKCSPAKVWKAWAKHKPDTPSE